MCKATIVEYSPQYAKAVAEMWNHSSEGWNGRVFNESEAKVLRDEACVSYLNLYLAVEEEKVLGYAKLTKYAEENGVAYIELLSVLPSHHGKGIGRDLVKQCVLRAAELGFGRIDLFTWEGNTKAVPLYKKCGFFWEKMENQSTHLMNFLPGLLSNELLKPYRDYFDWYHDSKRELKTEPDGRNANGFDLYDYLWEKDGKSLAVSFERFGRGIVAISTNDYSIRITTPTAKPVFGQEYPVLYQLENLSGKEMQIEVEGMDDGVIKHSFQHRQNLIDKVDLEAKFYIEPLSRELTEWECCPCVKSMLKLDGKELPLSIGLKVQYPLSASLRTVDSVFFPKRNYKMYLNLHNHFPCACSYRIEIPQDMHLLLLKNTFEILLPANEKGFIELEFELKQAYVYYPVLQVTATPENGRELKFTTNCCYVFPVLGTRHGLDMPEMLQIVNGFNQFYLGKIGTKNYVYTGRILGESIRMLAPQVGKPYSEEFENELAYETIIDETPNCIQATLKYRSRDLPGVDYGCIYRLYDSGLIDWTATVYALPESTEDMWAKFRFFMKTSQLAFMHRGKLRQIETDIHDLGTSDLPEDCPEENWLFGKDDDSCTALIWHPDSCINPEKYWLAWEINLSELMKTEHKTAEPVQIHLDVFKNPWQTRNAALGRKPMKPIQPTLELTINQGNPFLELPCYAELIQILDIEFNGKYSLESTCMDNPEIQLMQKLENNTRKVSWELTKKPTNALELISCTADLPYTVLERKQLMLNSLGEISHSVKDNLYSIDNGCLHITASTDARLPGLISLAHNGVEWLENNYPDYPPKSFFNPYQGGLSLKPSQISLTAMLQESHKVEITSLFDQFGNRWDGLAILTTINNYAPLKGFAYRQYYVMRPGVPVMAVLGEVVAQAGRAQYYSMLLTLCKQHQEGEADGTFLIPTANDGWQVIRQTSEQTQIDDSYSCLAMQIKEAKAYLQLTGLGKPWGMIYMDPALAMIMMNIHTDMVTAVPAKTKPLFMIFGEELYKKEWLNQLISVTFGEK